MEILKLACVLLLAPSLWALELKTSFGSVSYQVEGKGPTGTFWNKPSYTNESYFELESREMVNQVNSWKVHLEYIDGSRVLETNQPILRKVQTSIVRGGWGWNLNKGFDFEWGLIGINQTHHLEDSALTAKTTQSVSRLGNYFGLGFRHSFGLWTAALESSIGVLGWPKRQSAVSHIELGLDRAIAGSPWVLGLKIKEGFIELERDNVKTSNLGTVSNALLLFKQTETDTAILAFTVGYKL